MEVKDDPFDANAKLTAVGWGLAVFVHLLALGLGAGAGVAAARKMSA